MQYCSVEYDRGTCQAPTWVCFRQYAQRKLLIMQLGFVPWCSCIAPSLFPHRDLSLSSKRRFVSSWKLLGQLRSCWPRLYFVAEWFMLILIATLCLCRVANCRGYPWIPITLSWYRSEICNVYSSQGAIEISVTKSSHHWDLIQLINNLFKNYQ